eukprot:TRINITY_DN5274_c0_g1_i2.p5 TRINITY_DN5274_c0_g1~~TRINITY_DN5274_c0_g1_i2.p5  ORF type:complete len:139 (+),score=47.58 TRINITY_DN5274_c0_g1_i2:183-599(+)
MCIRDSNNYQKIARQRKSKKKERMEQKKETTIQPTQQQQKTENQQQEKPKQDNTKKVEEQKFDAQKMEKQLFSDGNLERAKKRQQFIYNNSVVYEWDQTMDEVNVYIKVPKYVLKKYEDEVRKKIKTWSKNAKIRNNN